MPVVELVTSSGLGSLLGMRHALEPDHLAAVSTLVTRERSGFKAALVGACWGLGHTLSLLSVGAVLIVLRAEGDLDGDGLYSSFERRAKVLPGGKLQPDPVLHVQDRVE